MMKTKIVQECMEQIEYMLASDQPYEQLTQIIARLIPGSLCEYYRWTGDDSEDFEQCSCSEGALPPLTPWIKSGEALRLRPFDPSKPFSMANCVYSYEDWKKADPIQSGIYSFKELHMDVMGYGSFCEVALYCGTRYLGNLSLFRDRADRPFQPEELVQMQSLVPLITRTLGVQKMLFEQALIPGQVHKLTEAIDGPVFLVTTEGNVVYANALARKLYTRYPEWLKCSTPKNKPANAQLMTTRIPLRFIGLQLWMVIPSQYQLHPEITPYSPWARYYNLPPRLSKVAALLTEGLSDKEISSQLGLELHTIRTYLKDLYYKMEVHSRTELVAKIFKFHLKR